MTRLAFPFGPAASGRSATVTYGSDAHIRQMLELLIFTLAGERVMRPDLGSPVTQMVFNPAGGPVAIALQAALQATIAQWLGHLLEVHDLSVSFDEAEAALEVAVTYEVLASKTKAPPLVVRKELA
jgi:phage baseplate assembly protein W